jgi:excisionase family DNA binding protein
MTIPADKSQPLPRSQSVSIDDAAGILGVSRRTVYNRIRTGRLRTVRTLLGSQRVLVDSLGPGDRRPSDGPGDRRPSDDQSEHPGAFVARRPVS